VRIPENVGASYTLFGLCTPGYPWLRTTGAMGRVRVLLQLCFDTKANVTISLHILLFEVMSFLQKVLGCQY